MVHNRVFDKDAEKQRHKQTGIDLSFLFPEKEQQERNNDKKRIPAIAAEQTDHHAGEQKKYHFMSPKAFVKDQAQKQAAEKQHSRCERNIFPDSYGKDGMIGDQGIEGGEQ